MIRRALWVFALVLGLAAPAFAVDQVIDRTYPLATGGSFTLENVNGSVQVGRPADLTPGSTQLAQIAIGLQLTLPTFGGYRVRVVAGAGDVSRSLPFRLTRRATAP